MEIKIELKNWQYNAGVVGLYNILEHSNCNVKTKNNALIFDLEDLNNFEEKYFKYFIDTYKNTLSIHRITNYKQRINRMQEELEEEYTDLKSISDEINNYITNILKKYVKSQSYIGAYALLKDKKIDPLALLKNINIIKFKKNDTEEGKKKKIEDTLKLIVELISFFNSKEVIKYVAAKNAIYTIIKNAWNNVCFLNSQTKEKNIYKDYNNFFVKDAVEYIESDKGKYKYDCFICDRKIKNLKNGFNFLNNTGFDIEKKLSHAWNFQNDVAMCPICKLVYSCVPAGFTYLYSNGLFVNLNMDINALIKLNNKIKMDILSGNKKTPQLYRALEESIRENIEYEIEDIQLIRFEDERYFFNIISKAIIKIIVEQKNELEKIYSNSYEKYGNRYWLLNEVMKKLLNNENLFELIHYMLYLLITNKENAYINVKNIESILILNFKKMTGVGYMKNETEEIIKKGRAAGVNLRKCYKSLNAEHKLNSICYKILNGIKSNNKHLVMDTIINSYLYCKADVPSIITKLLGETETFKEIGYAFLTGLLAIDYNKINNDKENNSNEE